VFGAVPCFFSPCTGQTADTVRVRKFIVEDSVEESIVELQKQKKDMASEVLSDVKDDSTMSHTRPTLEDYKLIFARK